MRLLRSFVVQRAPWLDRQTRTGRYFSTLGSSLTLFGAATFYSLGVVPLILTYESALALGLWTLVIQFGTWLGALDLGLSGSSVRFFVGPVAIRDLKAIKSRFQATFVFSFLQCLCVLLLGCLGPLFCHLFSIPLGQQPLFNQLFFTQCFVAAASFLVRPFSSILLAAQRFELNYLANAVAFLLSLPLAWWGLREGWGLWSLMAGCLLQHLVGIGASLFGVWRMGLFPSLLGSGFPPFSHLRSILKESLSFSIGSTSAIFAGIFQSVFLSRFLGLEAVAAWNIGAKAATVLGQILSKFFESSFGGLSELLEVGRRDRMFYRFGQVLGWSMVISGSLALALIFLNGPFVKIWTGGVIDWPLGGTWAVGIMLFLGTLHRALSEIAKILLLWREIRLSPIFDLGTLLIFLYLAHEIGGFNSFVYAAAFGPYLAGIIMNGRGLHEACGQPMHKLIPAPAQALLLALLGGGLGAAIWTLL